MPRDTFSPLYSGDPLECYDPSEVLSPITLDSYEQEEPHWSELFKFDQYDWNDPEFIAKNKGRHSWLPVELTQGYFMMVHKCDMRLAVEFSDGSLKKWYADVQRDEEGNILKVYAVRSGRRALDEPAKVYAHRELKGAIYLSGIVDHLNGWGLDNRVMINLRCTKHSANTSNSVRRRTKNLGLPVGVEIRHNKKGEIRYGGIRARRLKKRGPGSVITVRSKMSWKNPERAALWYQNQLKRLHKGRKSWAHNPQSIDWPVFPPLLEQEISQRSLQLRRRDDTVLDSSIPF